MRYIGARGDDWRPDNPRISIGAWIGGLVAVAALYIVVAGLIGSLVNGNGSPYLH
jgi:hypothetical protein